MEKRVKMSHSDDVASKAVRKSTLTSLKTKKRARLEQLKKDYEKAVREVNIQYAKDPERLKAKYAAADYAKSEKAKRRAEKKIQEETKSIDQAAAKRQFSVAEEITSSIVQGVGCAMSIAFIAILDTLAIKSATEYKTLTLIAYTLFGASLTLMYLFSVLHHAIRNSIAKDVFQRLSHAFTYFVIGFGYSAYTLTKIHNTMGWVVFGIVWLIALLGIIFYSIFGARIEKLTTIFYIVTGSVGILVMRNLYNALSPASFQLLIIGGLFYIAGVVFYSLRKIRFMHSVGNSIWLVASACMCMSLFFINA